MSVIIIVILYLIDILLFVFSLLFLNRIPFLKKSYDWNRELCSLVYIFNFIIEFIVSLFLCKFSSADSSEDNTVFIVSIVTGILYFCLCLAYTKLVLEKKLKALAEERPDGFDEWLHKIPDRTFPLWCDCVLVAICKAVFVVSVFYSISSLGL